MFTFFSDVTVYENCNQMKNQGCRISLYNVTVISYCYTVKKTPKIDFKINNRPYENTLYKQHEFNKKSNRITCKK